MITKIRKLIKFLIKFSLTRTHKSDSIELLKSKEVNMNKFIKIRVTPEFAEKIKKLCKKRGINFSKLVRDFLQNEFEKEGI